MCPNKVKDYAQNEYFLLVGRRCGDANGFFRLCLSFLFNNWAFLCLKHAKNANKCFNVSEMCLKMQLLSVVLCLRNSS